MIKKLVAFVLIIILVLAFALLLSACAASTDAPAADINTTTAPTTQSLGYAPGNYCISCHLADDPRLASATSWTGTIARDVNNPCPAAIKVHQELYYTERMLLMVDNAQDSVGVLSEKPAARLANYTQRYSRLLDVPVTSLDAFVGEAQTTRYQLNKVYTTLNAMAEASKLQLVLIIAGAVTLVVLGSLAWGLYNTRAVRAGLVSKSWATFWRILFVVAILGFFILPIFRVPAVEVAATTVEQQAVQATLDTAQRAADAADRAQARAWMLARIGTSWSDLDSSQGSGLMTEALSSLAAASENDDALWGQSLVVQEVSVGTRINMEKASLVAGDLNASRLRGWALPLVALEWNALDPDKAAALLRDEQAVVVGQSGFYRDLQLRSLALAWAQVDPSQSALAAGEITDPMLQAWTFRELASLLARPALFSPAVQAARLIPNPVQRARALGEIAQASGQSALFTEALSALQGITGASRAYALADLAVLSHDVSLVGQIDTAFPDAQASALLRLGEYQSAWDSADRIADPYEQARTQAAIAAHWSNPQAAQQIGVSLYRDLSLRDIIRVTGDASLVDSISSIYYKVEALTALGELDTAAQLAPTLSDTYPLIALSQSLAKSDPQAALDLVSKMTRETDKADALRLILALSHDTSLFDQAKGMALAARVSGDALAPSQASLELALALWPLDETYAQSVFQQAYEAAQRISIK